MGNSESGTSQSESNSECNSPVNVTASPTIQTGDVKVNTNGIQDSSKNWRKNKITKNI